MRRITAIERRSCRSRSARPCSPISTTTSSTCSTISDTTIKTRSSIWRISAPRRSTSTISPRRSSLPTLPTTATSKSRAILSMRAARASRLRSPLQLCALAEQLPHADPGSSRPAAEHQSVRHSDVQLGHPKGELQAPADAVELRRSSRLSELSQLDRLVRVGPRIVHRPVLQRADTRARGSLRLYEPDHEPQRVEPRRRWRRLHHELLDQFSELRTDLRAARRSGLPAGRAAAHE